MTAWSMSHAAWDASPSCPGTFAIVENDGRHPAWAECSACSSIITVSQSLLNAPPEATLDDEARF